MSAADDALDVARFVRPGVKVEETSCLGVWGARYEDGEEWFPSHRDIAAAERVLVERGLGAAYCEELRMELHRTQDAYARAAADTERRVLRAMARVVREQKPKEPK